MHQLAPHQIQSFERMLVLATAQLKHAYVPYKYFPVASVIEAPDGAYFSGVNVQNASFPIGMCAECSAVAAMVSAGHRIIHKILVTSASKQLCPPCGGCRQMISEFATNETQIALATISGIDSFYTIDQLLPLRFDAENFTE